MRAIHIDFAPSSSARFIASMRLTHWLLAIIGIGMGLGGMASLRDLAQQKVARQEELGRIETQTLARSTLDVGNKKPAISKSQAEAVNRAVRQLNLPWKNLLTAIEHATPVTVALLELTPDARKHLILGVAEASTAGAMFTYITRLKQQPYLGNVILTKHNIDDQDANRPLRFEFAAEWLEAVQ